MRMELDHLFICTAPGAPEAERLVQFGLREGTRNQHAGQGTANRRFPFFNAMIEFIWVSDAEEAQSPQTKPTLLWERWSGRNQEACPFGICLRPVDPASEGPPPFAAWEYRPSYLPAPLSMHIGEAGIGEPMWVFLGFMRRTHHQERFHDHPAGLREITGLTLTSPMDLPSEAARSAVGNGILTIRPGPGWLLAIEFDGRRRQEQVDFRPSLPLLFEI